jgi:hypothetical protein
MYCPACGKSVPDGSNFCLHCGSSMTAPKATSGTPVEWEYRDYALVWKPGQGGQFWLALPGFGPTENTIRLENWNHHQSRILSEIQELRDHGWEPITEIGPSAFSYRHHRGGIFDPIHGYLELTEFRVKMRRPKPMRELQVSEDTTTLNPGFSPSMPDRTAVVLKLLEEGETMLALDARRPGVRVPPQHRSNKALRLILDRSFPNPIEVTNRGISTRLKFNEKHFDCYIPMEALWAVYHPKTMQGMMWPESMPAEVAAEINSAKTHDSRKT